MIQGIFRYLVPLGNNRKRKEKDMQIAKQTKE